jgi:hypothetical protein
VATSNLLVAWDAKANFTITLASLTNGSARQSTMISNASPGYYGALVTLKIESGGSAPTAGTVYEVYLLRSDGTQGDDAVGASDAAITIENSQLLGTIVVTANANKNFYGTFDTGVFGPLPISWGIAVKNASGQTINSTEGNHIKDYTPYNIQAQ